VGIVKLPFWNKLVVFSPETPQLAIKSSLFKKILSFFVRYLRGLAFVFVFYGIIIADEKKTKKPQQYANNKPDSW
jgi:hypothetical protein